MVDAYRKQKRELNPLKLESQMAVSRHVGAGDKIPILCKWMSTELSLQPQVPQTNPVKTASGVKCSVFSIVSSLPTLLGK